MLKKTLLRLAVTLLVIAAICLFISCEHKQIAAMKLAEAQAFSLGAAKASPSPKSQGQGEVFTCGYPTKNGTPCKHRVKKQGDRCWQHKEK